MSYLLNDGRQLMASYQDIVRFFQENNIIGKTIVDIKARRLDYIISNLDEIENVENMDAESAVSTDGQICIFFDNGEHLELEIPGDGPLILGYNTADFSGYPVHDGSCYTLKTLFQHCIGRRISNIVFEKSKHPMLFPAYRGIDISKDDNGIKYIKLVLDDKSVLLAEGVIDYFHFSHCDAEGNNKTVPFSSLLAELNGETKKELLGY